MSQDRGEEQEQPRNQGSAVWEQISTLLVAVAIALAIRAFVIEPFRIPSGSMFPTLLVGDHLFVNKFVYGVKVPLTDYRMPGLREPEHGDVIVFTVAKGPFQQTFPADERPDLPREEYVKRIVGLPGDVVEVRGDVVTINGQPMDVRPLDRDFIDPAGRQLEVEEVHVDDRSYEVLDDPRKNGLQQRPFTVPEGRYFVLGDNRDHSKDSRDWGTVRLAEVKGPAFVLYWSWDFEGTWAQLFNPITWFDLLTEKTRWDRFFDRVR